MYNIVVHCTAAFCVQDENQGSLANKFKWDGNLQGEE